MNPSANLILAIEGAQAELIAKGLLNGKSLITIPGLVKYDKLKSKHYIPKQNQVIKYLTKIDKLSLEDAYYVSNLILEELTND